MSGEAPTTLVFLRHGESEANRSRTFNSRDDDAHPLTETGRRQAEAAAAGAAAERFVAAYCSPLQRARQTAEIVAARHPGLTLRFDERLRELYCGELEGRNDDAAERVYLETQDRWAAGALMERMGGGETFIELRDRLLAVSEEAAARHPGGRILIVAHAALLRWGMTALLQGLELAAARKWRVCHCVPFLLFRRGGAYFPSEELERELREFMGR